MTLFFYTLVFGLLLFLAGWMFFVFFFTRRLLFVYLRGEAPFVPSKVKILPKVVEALDINDNDIVCDLGCGDARVLVACCLKHPNAKYVGYENDYIPYLWAKYRLWRMGLLEEIKIIKKDFFDADFSRSTKIFAYLGSKQMEKLEKKMKAEMKKGSKLVSLKFKLPNHPAVSNPRFQKEDIYIYEF